MPYRKTDITINGTKYKRIIKVDEDGWPIYQKDIPLVSRSTHASGGHFIFNNPSENHFDHQKGTKKWREYKYKREA